MDDVHASHINFKHKPYQKDKSRMIALNKTYCLFGKQVEVDVYKDKDKNKVGFNNNILSFDQGDKIKISDKFRLSKHKKKTINYVKINSGLFEKNNRIEGQSFKNNNKSKDKSNDSKSINNGNTPPIKNNVWHKFVNMNRTLMLDNRLNQMKPLTIQD